MPLCTGKGCNNRTYRKSQQQEEIEKEQKITFHSNNTAYCTVLKISEASLKQKPVICSMHFYPEDFDTSSLVYVKLKPDAIPDVRHTFV
ncbi:uncharacterized protein LOC114254588 [Monomorium pharaonis]|uniref:uncharacterized protein LOC114254588 n=1 Tax=Monomorium pharaonis TaxID=307658 RepID=UPI00102E19D4|nr:uncharacterized protein LOC114254588 [Monomorium pharaonis]